MINKRGSGSIRRLWWGVDVLGLGAILLIMMIGVILIATASPAVAERVRLDTFHFLYKHLIFLFISIPVLVFFARTNEKFIKKFVLFGTLTVILLMILVLFIGEETKGAKRWITILGFSLQPSEFAKSFLAVIFGLLLSERQNKTIGIAGLIFLYLLVCGLLLLQPDFGMTVSITVVTAVQLFVAGMPIILVLIAGILFVSGVGVAYLTLPHVAKRINSFWYVDELENYQVTKSLEAYANGGLFGKGPGEGAVKYVLPDSHTDFIFAVAGEEFGGLCAIIILLLFMMIILRGLNILSKHQNLFHVYASIGILMHFTFQTIFNIGVTLHLLPTKGMTLPFISYGGSSMLSFAIGMGIYLNFLRSADYYDSTKVALHLGKLNHIRNN